MYNCPDSYDEAYCFLPYAAVLDIRNWRLKKMLARVETKDSIFTQGNIIDSYLITSVIIVSLKVSYVSYI